MNAVFQPRLIQHRITLVIEADPDGEYFIVVLSRRLQYMKIFFITLVGKNFFMSNASQGAPQHDSMNVFTKQL